MRSGGVLMHISSLPSAYGIGTFGEEARRFVDFLAAAGQKYWQVLPLGATGFGDSPYQSFSAFAGNPYFIDLEYLCYDRLLTKEECDSLDWGESKERVDYGIIYENYNLLLHKAYTRFQNRIPGEYMEFCEKEKDWLEDYSLFMALKDKNGGKCWQKWDKELVKKEPQAMEAARQELKEEIGYYKMQQFLFLCHWKALKGYANERGIQIIGDIPIYVSLDSVEVWASPEQFCLDEEYEMNEVAGCPPDAFSEEGQLWGNPLFDWDFMEKDGYSWWKKRVRHMLQLYDVLRIDHFRGFDSYYAIPAEDTDARNGVWKQGPGMKLFKALREALGDVRIIVEDLGHLTESVLELVHETGYPGMKVLQFAFDGNPECPYLPHHYKKNCIAYTGTHDNDTILSWYEGLSDWTKGYVDEYLRIHDGEPVNWTMMRAIWASVADLSIVTMQDLLDIGEGGRMNTPATVAKNWQWRMKKDSNDTVLAQKIRNYMGIYSRLD